MTDSKTEDPVVMQRWEVTLTTKIIVSAPTLQDARDSALWDPKHRPYDFDVAVRKMWPTNYP